MSYFINNSLQSPQAAFPPLPGILMTVDYNTQWSTKGATGILILSGNGKTYTGNSVVDNITLTNAAVINKNGYTLTYTTLTNTSGTINN